MLLVLAAGIRADGPIFVQAQSPASNQETTLSPSAGLRVGYVDNDGGGMFVGGEGMFLVGMDSQGTNEVSVVRLPAVLEGRGLIGSRFKSGLFGIGGYGYGGAGAGGGFSFFKAFDDSRVRPFGLWQVRGGGGVELSFGPAMTRIELGMGLRDLRYELHGSFAVGGSF